MEKLLTVSIAAYNVEQFLKQTLDSLILPPEIMEKMEVIIVNDGSKDGTAQLSQSYVDKYPHVFKLVNKENGGWGSTVNTSIELAQGKYFKLLDGDDWFDKDGLTKLLEALDNVSEDIVFTQFLWCYEDSDGKTKLDEQSYPYNERLDISEVNRICMHSLTIKTELLKKNGVRLLEHCFYTDVEYFIRSVDCAQTMISYPICVYCYRIGRDGQSVSVSGYLRHADEHEAVMHSLLDVVSADKKKYEKLLPSVQGFILMHFSVLTWLEPTRENLKKFIAFRDYVKSVDKIYLGGLNGKFKLAIKFPRLLYKPVCKFRRKKYNVE